MAPRSNTPTSISTYSLRADNFTADEFYGDLALFTDETLLRLRVLEAWVASFRAHRANEGAEETRSSGEYLYELLALGVYWQEYGAKALGTARPSTALLHFLVRQRRRFPSIKDGIDALRGRLGGLLLHREVRGGVAPVPAPAELRKLVRWLDATGDFREEALRLNNWVKYFATLPAGECALVLMELMRIIRWFRTAADATLHAYTSGVDSFADTVAERYRFREDRVFCGRRSVEYHLSMVGAEIMNRAFRGDFLAAPRKLVGVPGCMRIRTKETCEAAVDAAGDLRCTGCTKSCRVFRLSEMTRKHGAEVVIIPHSTNFSQWAERKGLEGRDAIVGVACVPALIAGGLELKANGVPAQCVFLDYSGCRNHWDAKGIVTDLDERQLRRILEPSRGELVPKTKPARRERCAAS
ncbi:MAG: DUF116 domain-containing protein [Ignavibacteria bacterium]|nr:DUF116 domain-containing protein [Ignavibacteria bacterium]